MINIKKEEVKMSKDQNPTTEKSPDEILKQHYITAKDLTVVIPGLKIERARIYIRDLQEEMIKKEMFVPESREKLAATKLFRKKFGI